MEQHNHTPHTQLSDILSDERALRELIELHWEKLLAYCQHYTQDHEASVEIVQDVFCSIWDKRKQTRIRVDIERYLFAIARNKIARHYRDKYRDKGRQANATALFAEKTNNTEETIYWRDMQEYVSSLVNRLPDRCGEVYVLSRDKGLAINEIAEKLSISKKTVETHLTKALKFLRRHLHNERY